MSQIEPQQCVRHPERTTYLSCTRCGRPSCPQCLVPAAVGFHCVDCVASQPVSRGRTRLGFQGTDGNPRVTKAIIAIAIVVYALQSFQRDSFQSEILVRFSLIGLAQTGQGLIGVATGEWWRLITVGFLHAGLLHIAFNMYALWLLGPSLEQILGHRRFLGLYAISLLGGSTASYFFNAPNTPAVGASGAIFGLFGATVVVSRRLGRDASGIYGIIGLNLIIGFLIPQVDWRAHLGGLIAGAAAAWVIGRGKQVQRLGTLSILAALVIAIAIRTAELRSLLGL